MTGGHYVNSNHNRLHETSVTCNNRFMDVPADRRTELLGRIVDALLASGAAELSLRPLAGRVGTSARLLIYHFGSKERLVADALAEIRRRIQASLGERAAAVKPGSLRALVMMAWDWATEAENQGYFRLLFEVDGLAMFDRLSPSEADRKANSDVWIVLIERAARELRQDGALFAANSTLIVAAFVGLLQEFLSTGDRERTAAALEALIDLIAMPARVR